MEPYRTAGLRCPQCPDVSLREFHDRLICDECQGMLIEEQDLAKACGDLVSKDVTLGFSDAKPTNRACPKCERALASCEVSFAPVKAKADVLRCDRHGLWFRTGLLAGLFALLGRRNRGVFGHRHYEERGPTGLDGLPIRRHNPASSALRISEWRNQPRRRAKTLTPINAYRDQPLPCPVCKTTELKFYGDRFACAQCAGTFVQNAAFEAMAIDISNQPFELPLPTGAAGPRACPVCNQAMLVETIENIPIDRCAAHGMWFDATELAAALEQASGQFEHGWRAWLERVFS